MTENPYEYFGIKKTATKDDIKKAFRKKAKKQHPDVSQESQDFKKSVILYNLLMDDSSRDIYDRTGQFEQKASANIEYSKMTDYFMRACTSSDPVYENIIEKAKDMVRGDISLLQNSIKQIEDTKKNFYQVLDRMSTKRPEENILKITIENVVQQNETGKANNEREIKLLEKVLELFEDYEYKCDEQSFSTLGNFAMRFYPNATTTGGW